MSDHKPPMTVWLAENNSNSVFMRFTEKPIVFLSENPYVHIEQFMEEVERRASPVKFPHARNSAEAGYYAMQELAKEIAEGKT